MDVPMSPPARICEDITRKIKRLKDTMVTYFLRIDHVLSSDPKVLTRVIPTMKRA
jgi:hypothetical protein